MNKINGDRCHAELIKKIKPKLSFSKEVDFKKWRDKVSAKLKKLLGLDLIEKNACDLNVVVEKVIDKGNYTQIRFSFESEKGNFVPCYILKPNTNKKNYPVMICLQGHTSGFHNSIGEPKFDGDKEYINSRGDFGVLAVNLGYVALCIEQRGMGETLSKHSQTMCDFTAHSAILMGRTLIGERVWDTCRAIDALKEFPFADINNITCMGNSGGGTTTFYTLCFEKRIKHGVVSCAFSSYKDSIGSMFHCACNYIPHLLNFFDMGDLSCLIAPKKLTIFAGINDKIFPITGVKEQFEVVKAIYKILDCQDKCNLFITNYDHYFDKELFAKRLSLTSIE